MSSIHPDIADRLVPYLDGQLDEGLRRQVQEHLESCRVCSEELASLGAIVRALRQAGHAERVAGMPADRYACPGPDELTAHVMGEPEQRVKEGGWIDRHLPNCVRCRQEADLIRQMGADLSAPDRTAVPDDLSARVMARLVTRVQREHRADGRTPVAMRLPGFKGPFLVRVVLGMGLAVVIAVLGLRYVQSDRPVLVATRPPAGSALESGGIKSPSEPSPQKTPARETSLQSPSALAKVERAAPVTPRSPAPSPEGTAELKEGARAFHAVPAETLPQPPARPPSSVAAKIESPPLPPPASGIPFRLDAPVAAQRGGSPQATPPMPSKLPPLVSAKQGEPLKVLILPIASHPGLRSAVAAVLHEQLETLQPPERDFPAEPSVDDLAANRRLGRMFGVRYVIGVDVTKMRSGYQVVLRAADTETGGIAVTREGLVQDEGALSMTSTRLAKELQQEIKARP